MSKAQEILQKMTLHEKIGQLTQYNGRVFVNTEAAITGPDAEAVPVNDNLIVGPAAQLGLTKDDLAVAGSVLNFSCTEEAIQIQDAHLKNDPHKIPLTFMMDVIHGFRTIFPIPLAMGCSFNPELVEECSAMAAKEASATGVQVTFTPMVDYVRDPRWGRVMETGGEEPRVTGALAAAQIRGFQGDDFSKPGKIATCIKHYAGYGGAEAGRDYNLVEVSPRELREYYLPAYKACVDAGSPMIMPSFNSLNGVPSIANPMLMKKILKQEWGFDGVVISDYAAVNELISHGVAADEKEAAKLAFANGCDIEMCSSTYFHHLQELVEEGVFTEEQLDTAVLRVLEFKEALGLFEDPYHGADPEKANALYLCPEHRAIVRKAVEESAVLLKNNGVLPLSKDLAKVALIGPFAHNHAIKGSWSCTGRDEDTVTMYEGVSALLGSEKVVCTRGCGNAWDDTDVSGMDEAVALARDADAVILCLGEPQEYSGEGNCRADLRLPGMQEELARRVCAANPNTAVVLFNGRPLDLSTLDSFAPAILELWFPGTEGGNGAANLLFGDANPCGKLTMTFPRSVGQCPIYYNHPNTGRPHWTDKAEHIGYTSDYIGCATLPLYSFGHGLSYSKFTYLRLSVSAPQFCEDETLQVRIRVRNDSDRSGKETVQLYMRDLVASAVRPVQQLIAFQKISLAPGEEKEVCFDVTADMLGFFNMDGEFTVEKGDFRLMTGCADHFLLDTQVRLI